MAESILHFGAVTLRLNGFGNLDMKLSSLDNVSETDLLSLPMTALASREPTRLSNFNSQRGSLTVSVSEIDEWFVINRIVVWIKEVATSFPM